MFDRDRFFSLYSSIVRIVLFQMVAPAPKFGVRFLSRKERTVRRVTKYETKEIQKRKLITNPY